MNKELRTQLILKNTYKPCCNDIANEQKDFK